MLETEDVRKMHANVSELAKRLAASKGEHAALGRRKAELERNVGLAKGRLDRKKDVEKFIEEIQSEAHAKRVGSFERLLTALVSEVLPGEKPIGFELDIERGQPSLDIVSRVGADLTEDIFEDQGGALTNIVVLGLRMIAVVRSGMRRFIVLDEPDCWVKTERVPSFYSVVKDAAKKLGMQCFVISHHNTSIFSEGIAVSNIHGHPENTDGVVVENNARAYRWRDDEDGFRYIRLKQFQGYVDQTLKLSPGVNALVGDNNIGKSSFVRAFRAVFYGDNRDTLIRRGEKECTVEIGLPGDRVLRWTRQRRKNPTWSLLRADMTPISDEYETTSRTPPEWVLKEAGIGPVIGLDPHIVKQKLPVFLLDKPGSTRASVLAIGQEADHIRDMVKTYKKMCERDSAIVKDGEEEMGRLLDREQKLARALEYEETITELEGIVSSVEARKRDAARMEEMLERLARLQRSIEKGVRIKALLDGLPDRRDIADIEASVKASINLERTVGDAIRLERENDIARRRLQALKGLPERPPTIIHSDALIRVGKAAKIREEENARLRRRLEVLAQLPEIPVITMNDMPQKLAKVTDREAEVASLRQNRVRIDGQISEIVKRMKDLVDEMGGTCPTCGGHVDADALIAHSGMGHVHG